MFINGQTNSLCNIHAMRYYLAMEMTEIQLHAMTGKNITNVILTQRKSCTRDYLLYDFHR
jgi:hypothetical protein